MNPYDQSVKQRSRAGEIFLGIGVGLALHIIQLPVVFVGMTFDLHLAAVSAIFIGVSQLVYVVPAIVVCLLKGRSGIVIGLVIIAAITFLLNAACWGFGLLVFSGILNQAIHH
jgi:hypothetical protein